jgi:hypothetical protein
VKVPSEVREHDRGSRERNEDLESWVSDETRRLKLELDGITEEMNKAGLLWGGAHGVAVAAAKERALHAFRDQERQARRDITRLRESETWAHGVWRKLRGRRRPELTASERVEPVLEVWRAPVTRHLADKTDSTVVEVDDPTRRNLDATITELEEQRSAFV